MKHSESPINTKDTTFPLKKRKKATFTLKIDHEVVEVKYGFNIVSNIGNDNKSPSTQEKTKLNDLPGSSNHEAKQLVFMDESKQTHLCQVTMIDHLNSEKLSSNMNIDCFWCRSAFDSQPIGCPIGYIPPKITKNYHSEITKDQYSITDNVTEYRRKTISTIIGVQDSKFEINDDHGEYYLIDGIFCSFNCCVAFIEENKSISSLYQDSEDLLYSLYNKLVQKQTNYIIPAPHWRLLKKYGGHMTINEFRNTLGKAQFIDHNDYKYVPPVSTKLIGHIFEKKVRF